MARALVTAHPTMASIWNAVGIALESPGDFDMFVRRVARAARGLAHVVPGAFPRQAEQREALRFVTCSVSGSVGVCLGALARDRQVAVACAEGRPLFEGRSMADRVVGAGIKVISIR